MSASEVKVAVRRFLNRGADAVFDCWRNLEVSCSGRSVDRGGSSDALLMRLRYVFLWSRVSEDA